MRWIKPVIAIFSLGLLSCELGEVELNNPLDTQANAEKGIRYNAPFFKFDWPTKEPTHISVKDDSWPDFTTE